jgi:hypothetical protein
VKPLQQYPDHALVAMLMAARGEVPGTRPSFDTEDIEEEIDARVSRFDAALQRRNFKDAIGDAAAHPRQY